ncbi:hypothetical protein [Actinomyces sp. 432]|uniref:hypothetical protein n=1 Tax=Actinomyces sp. 432 TaxID=2057798 RepID=UPI001F27A889|nr:hypothetical protein [Actinomyces sp. 432]
MTEPHFDPTAGAAAASAPGAADADSADALAARALARERGRAWDAGLSRRALSRQAADADGVAAWDRRRRGAGDEDADAADGAEMDRGPGLPPGRDRPGPTRFDPRTGTARSAAGTATVMQAALAYVGIGYGSTSGSVQPAPSRPVDHRVIHPIPGISSQASVRSQPWPTKRRHSGARPWRSLQAPPSSVRASCPSSVPLMPSTSTAR